MATPLKKNNKILISWLNDYFSLIIIILIVLFLLFSYYLILKPKLKNEQELMRDDIKKEEILYARNQKKLAILENIQKVYKNIKVNDLQKFNSVLPSYYVPDQLFGELAEIVNSGGWITNSIDLGSKKKENSSSNKIKRNSKIKLAPSVLTDLKKYPGLKENTITLSVSAIDYPGLKRLLHTLESNLRLIDVTNLSFSPKNQNAILTLHTYYYQDSH